MNAKSWILVAAVTVTAVALVVADVADAKRLGGGRSLGTQRSMAPPAAGPAPSTTAPSGAASNPVMPATPGTAAARPAAPAPAASGASRWLGPIAGLAAGLGLAALLSHFGLSEGFASVLLVMLLVVGGVILVRMLLGARRPATQAAGTAARYGGVSPISGTTGRFQPANQVGGSDDVLSAPPTWGNASLPPARGNDRYPAGFEPVPFLEQAKLQFRRLQEAHDRGDRETLQNVMTPALYHEVTRDLDERRTHLPTEVVALDAEILEVVEEMGKYVASLRFHGMLREDGARDAAPFVEIWNLEKPVNGSSGWMLAGIQQPETAA